MHATALVLAASMALPQASAAPPDTVGDRRGSMGAAIALAVAAGGVGLVAGGVVGYTIDRGEGGEWDGLGGFLLGSAVGEGVGVAAGAWIGDGRRGKLGAATGGRRPRYRPGCASLTLRVHRSTHQEA